MENFHEDRSSRLILSAFETALKSVKPQQLVSQAIRGGKKQLTVRDIYGKVTKLQGFDQVYIVGAGKATAGMANALCSILDNRIAGGAITIPYGANVEINGIQVTQASHPIPNQAGVKGTHSILSVLKKVGPHDLVIVLISGGGSALMPLPAPGISLADKQRITALLLRSGASIHEINAVRKHLSAIKGGQLLRQMNKSCKVLSLILS
ncbi:MAG TPA: glycerate-2-kinase family protein, partial [Nitrososphaera sp.]